MAAYPVIVLFKTNLTSTCLRYYGLMDMSVYVTRKQVNRGDLKVREDFFNLFLDFLIFKIFLDNKNKYFLG